MQNQADYCSVLADMMLALREEIDLTMLKEIDKDVRYLIFGYMRSSELLFDDNNPYYNIPDFVCTICLWYYCILYMTNDKFDIAAGDIEISEDKLTITKGAADAEFYSVYGTQGIPSMSQMHCKWKFKMNRLYGNCYVGISSKKCLDSPFHYKSSPNYCYYMLGWKIKCGQFNDREKYGKKFWDRDYLTMELDMNKKELRYAVNDEDQGVAFDDIECGDDIIYYLAITIEHTGDHLSMIDYQVNNLSLMDREIKTVPLKQLLQNDESNNAIPSDTFVSCCVML